MVDDVKIKVLYKDEQNKVICIIFIAPSPQAI